MDEMVSRFKDLELGLENGVSLSVGEDSRFSKVEGNSVEGSLSSDASNSGRVCVENLLSVNVEGQEDKSGKENKLVKEKRKSLGHKKPPKPPRPPRAPSLGAADQKLIKEIAELARLKRARIERMKALKKLKATKPATSSSSNMFAMVFTIIFCLVIMFQGMSPGSTPSTYQGSPSPAESGLTSLQSSTNPSASVRNQPGSQSPYLVEQVAGLESHGKLSKSSG